MARESTAQLVQANVSNQAMITAVKPRPAWDGLLIPAILAVAVMALHLAFVSRYGIFRDELYYIACSKRLAWGYVDQPPLSIVILRITRVLLGDSVAAIRTPVVLASGLTIFVVGLTVREIGGSHLAQTLACCAAALAPVYLAVDHFFSMNALDILLWAVALYLFTRTLQQASLRLWLYLGAALGLGLLNKWSVLWLIAGLVAGLVLTPYRRLLRAPGPWVAGIIAAACMAPQIAWQAHNGWPTPEFVHNATTEKMATVSPVSFFVMQLLAMNIGAAPIWLIGLAYGLFSRSGRKWAPLCFAFVTVAAILILNGKSRVSYLSPAYPPILALGAAAIERALQRWREMPRRALAGSVFAVLVLGGAVSLPLAVPVLSAHRLVGYMNAIGARTAQEERGKPSLLPQNFADEFGWEELAATVASVYQSLPPDERARCAIYASNYGEAGAIDYWAQKYGLPGAISGHNNYWLWGPRGPTGDVMILINADQAGMRALFRTFERRAALHAPYSMPFEQEAPIYVARGLKIPIGAAWPKMKRYI